MLASAPVFKLAASVVTEDWFRTTMARELSFDPHSVRFFGSSLLRVVDPATERYAEADLAIGRFWYGNRKCLWNPDALPASLLAADEARAAAVALLGRLNLWPRKRFGAGPTWRWTDHSRFSRYLVASQRREPKESTKLDIHVAFTLLATVQDAKGVAVNLPVVGTGATAGVGFQDSKSPLVIDCSWREVEAKAPSVPILSAAKSFGMVVKTDADFHADFAEPFLAYEYGRGPDGLILYPVHVFLPLARTADGPDRPPTPRAVIAPAVDLTDIGWPWVPSPSLPTVPPDPLVKAADETHREVGVTCIAGPAKEFKARIDNARLFVKGITRNGWILKFEGDETTSTIDRWFAPLAEVDSIDLMYYTGDASESSWLLAGGRRFSNFRAEQSADASGRLGADLEWLVIAACGPLQDTSVPGSLGDVFSWRFVFAGLRMLLGYATTTVDVATEGETFVAHAVAGAPIREAWFRTGREAQCHIISNAVPPWQPAWSAVLYPRSSSHNPHHDRLPAQTSAPLGPIGDPEEFVAIWVPV